MAYNNMHERNPSEQRFYEVLLNLGFSKLDISEPDKEGVVNPRKLPDFEVFKKIVFEVKNRKPNIIDQLEINNALDNLKNGEIVTWSVNYPSNWMASITKDAKKKFENFPDHISAIVVDFYDWFPLNPHIDNILSGFETIHLNAKSEHIGTTWKGRLIQPNIRQTEIGAYFRVTGYGLEIYHNKYAKKHRQFSGEFITRFQELGVEQYFITFDKKGNPIIYNLVTSVAK